MKDDRAESGMEAPSAAEGRALPPGHLDELMLAMDVVDTLRHRERLIERELDQDLREEQLIAKLRALYKSQGIEVPERIIREGVKGLKESRFVYTPPEPGLPRTLAMIWVRRAVHARRLAIALAALVLSLAAYQLGVVLPRERAAEAARIELVETLPRALAAAREAVIAEARVASARERADATYVQGTAALARGNREQARAAVSELDALAAALRQEYVLRIAGRPEDETGFFREHPSFQGLAYFLVVDALDPRGNPVPLPVRNDETNETETVSHFAVRVPRETFEAVRSDKARNGIVQNARLAEKRRGFLEPDYLMPVLGSRITRW